MKKRFNAPTIIGIMILVAAVTFTITFLSVEKVFADQLTQEKQRNTRIEKLIKVLDTIENSYIGDYDVDTLIDGGAAGMVAATGDRWSFYLTAEDHKDYKMSLANEQVGIGVSVVYDEAAGGMVVARVFPGSPADTAGLEKYDTIVSVEGEKVTDLGYTETLSRVRGAENTSVTVGVLFNGEETPRDIEIARQNYQINSVTSEIIEGNIGYIKIDNFDQRVDINFANSLQKLLDAGVGGLVFDVRGNPGGMKDVMVSMLDLLCPEGKLFIMRDKQGHEYIDYSDANEVDLPMMVLIDGNSYSAAEFFAAALQEYGKATIVGTPTTGKGYSQVTMELYDGSAINISTKEYFTPAGKSLIGVGVTPDQYIELSFEGYFALMEHQDDNQLKRAIEILQLEMVTREAANAAG